ncbi:MAG: hypothetical protein F6K42_24085 [Leptolyngbya sp. SIO1D8]|nr:hypothetical protein [Leptolyngbya sp. SIO1D8]
MNPSSSSTTPEILLQKYAQGERDFSDISLNECTLSGAKLPHIVLQRASLKVVNLSTANLSYSDLSGAILNVSRLNGTNLSQACLQKAQLNVANLIRAVLVGADLAEASLIRAELLRADLSNANLAKANLQEADLREARLRWTRLNGANLSQCDLRNSSLLGANLSSAQLYSAKLDGATLSGSVLLRAELRHANLQSADLSGANLRGANLRWANLSGANLQEADLTDAKLSGANLMGARLSGATLENTTLVHADLSRTNFQGVYCVNSDLSGATLTGTSMHGAVCYDVQTMETVFEWVDLSPSGDRSQVHQFNQATDIHAFLNHRPPRVQVIVDLALTQAAHAILATAYEQIGQAVALFDRPPHIEVTHRRTTLTFIAQEEASLAMISYLATWPFQDGITVQATLVDLMEQKTNNPNILDPQEEDHQKLHEAITILERQELQPLQRKMGQYSFFAAPIQVKLSNRNGKILELYHNPRFGVRNLPPTDGLFPIQSGYLPAPQPQEYLIFLSASSD